MSSAENVEVFQHLEQFFLDDMLLQIKDEPKYWLLFHLVIVLPRWQPFFSNFMSITKKPGTLAAVNPKNAAKLYFEITFIALYLATTSAKLIRL